MSVVVGGKQYHVSLSDGEHAYGFNIVRGSDSRIAVNDWAPIYSTGDQQFAEGTWQPVAYQDWSGGVGLERYLNAAETQYHRGSHVETRIPGRITLGGVWELKDAGQAATANPIDYDTGLYVPCEKKLRRCLAGVWSTVNDGVGGRPGDFAANITHLHVDGANLFIALGTGSPSYKYVQSTNTFTALAAGLNGQCFATALGKVWYAKGNHVYGGTDGTTFATDITVGDASANIVALYPYNEKLYIGKSDSLWEYNGTNVLKKLDFATSKYEGNFAHMREWGGYLFFNILRRVYKYSPSSIADVTPTLTGDADKELYGWGVPIMMCATPSALLSAFKNGENAYSNVLAYTGSAWHPVYAGVSSTLAAVGYSRNMDWIVVNDGATRVQQQIAQADRCDGHYEATGWIELPWFDAGYRLFKKSGKEVVIESRDCTAEDKITIKYRTTDGAGWTTLASQVVSSASPTTISLDPAAGALEFFKIQFRLELERRADTTKTPTVTSFILRYLIRPARTYAYSAQLRLSTKQRQAA